MNSSGSVENLTARPECRFTVLNHIDGDSRHLSTLSYAAVFSTVVFNSVVCPFTILLNILSIVVVTTKPLLKTKSNCQLACLAVTDVLVGLTVQPSYITSAILLLQGNTASSEFCWILAATETLGRILCRASIIHLVLLSLERHIAIIHPYVHHTEVTRSRIVAVSVTAWIVNFLLHVPEFFDPGLALRIVNSLLLVYVAMIIICQVSVCREIRRHEKLIAAQQVSREAKERFLKDQKATKITTAIVIAAVISYLPMFIFRAFLLKFGKHISLNVAYPCHLFNFTLVIVNSFVNSLIYAVRVRTFRVAFIEVLFKRNSHQAEQIEMKLFSKGVADANTVAAAAAGRTAQELPTTGVAPVLTVDRTASSTTLQAMERTAAPTSTVPAKSSAVVAAETMLSPTTTPAAERPASPTTAVAAEKTASPTTAESERAASPTTVPAGAERAALIATAAVAAAAGERAASSTVVAVETVPPSTVSEAERTAPPTTTAEAETERRASTAAAPEADKPASPTKAATAEGAASPTAAAAIEEGVASPKSAAAEAERAAAPTTAEVRAALLTITAVAAEEAASPPTAAKAEGVALPTTAAKAEGAASPTTAAAAAAGGAASPETATEEEMTADHQQQQKSSAPTTIAVVAAEPSASPTQQQWQKQREKDRQQQQKDIPPASTA